MQKSAARFAARNYRDAGNLHAFVHWRGSGADWIGALANTAGRCSSSGEHHEEVAFRWRAAHRTLRGVDGNDFFPAGFPIGAGARVVCNVARWFASTDFWTGASQVSHA